MTTKHELIQCIVDQGVTQADFIHYFATDDQALIDAARERYVDSSDDIEIDPFPLISEADEGTWVSAWVWVPGGDEEGNDDE